MQDTETLPDSLEAADDALLSGDETPSDATPAAVDPASPAPAEPAQPRNEQGQFTSPAPSPAPSLEAPAGAPAVPEPEVTPTLDAWAIQGDGQPFVVEGSQAGEEGVFIPAAARQRVERLIQQGLAWDGSAQRILGESNTRQQRAEQRAKAADEGKAAVEAQMTQMLGTIEKLIEDSIGVPDEQLFNTSLGQWLLNRRQEWGILKAEAKATRIEREGKAARDRLEEIEAQQRDAELRPQMASTLSDHILTYGQRAGLSRDVMEDIYATLSSKEYEGLTWIKAPHDDPLHGITKGETVLNVGIVEREVTRATKWAPKAAPVVPNGKPPVASAPVKKPTPPPTVSATRGPAPRKVLAEPQSKEEADRWLSDGGNDPD